MGCKPTMDASKGRRILGLVKIDWVMGSYECSKMLSLLKEPLVLRMED